MASRDSDSERGDLRELVRFAFVGVVVLVVLAAVGRGVLDRGQSSAGWRPWPSRPQYGSVAAGDAEDEDEVIRVFDAPVREPDRRASHEKSWKDRFPGVALVTAEMLANPEFAEAFRILDVSPRSQYETRHIPGAVWVDSRAWSKEFADSRDRQAWEERIGALGIDVNTRVLVYDEGYGVQSDSLRSILLYWGVKDVRLLDGGWRAWLFHGGHQESTVPQVTRRRPRLSPNPNALSLSEGRR